MNMPWTSKTGLAKAAAVFATLLLVSMGLCGLNFVGVIFAMPLVSSARYQSWQNFVTVSLFVGAYAEIAGMALGALGLIITGIFAVVKSLGFGRSNDDPSSEK